MPKRKTKRKYRAKSKRRYTKRRKKPSRKVVAARAKAKKKRIRRVKLINKTIRRVQTKLADEKGVMYRMKLTSIQSNQLPNIGDDEANGPAVRDLDQLGFVNDGDFVKRDRYNLPLRLQDFFTIDAFHGICMPKFQAIAPPPGITAQDPNWERLTMTGKYVPQDRVGLEPDLSVGDEQDIDIRAMRTVQLPFIPCIPHYIDQNVGAGVTQVAERWKYNELDRFARKGSRIKILNNYFRFKFYVRPDENGIRGVYNGEADQDMSAMTITNGRLFPTSYETNINSWTTQSTVGALQGAIHDNTSSTASTSVQATTTSGSVVQTPGSNGSMTALVAGPNVNTGAITWDELNVQHRQRANKLRSYTLSAKRSAKIRIIVVSRENVNNTPIRIEDFLKPAADYSMADEGYRMDKFFHRKKRTERDIYREVASATNALDAQHHMIQVATEATPMSVQRRMQDVTFIYDKVHTLRIGFNMVRLNLLKGKVLVYEETDPTLIGIQGGEQTIPETQGGPPPTTDDNYQAVGEDVVPEGNANSGFVLPTSTEAILQTMNATDLDGQRSNAMRMEYCPKGRQYAMFMLVKNVRCSTEWEIFQKFEYDK